MKIFLETWIFFVHYFRSSMRNPIWIIVALFQPICYLFLYMPLFQGISEQTTLTNNSNAIKVFEPGLLVMLALFSSMFVGFAMIDDLKSGVIERFRVTPVSRFSVLIGRSLRDVVILLIQSIILLLLSIPLGLNADFICSFMLLGMVILVGFFMAPISYALALTLKTEDSVGSIINFFTQPMILLSGILLPIKFAPNWLKNLSAINPLRYVVDACRELFAGNLLSPVIYQGIIVAVVMVVLALWCGARSFNNATMS